jgi:hypothetical protein
MSLKNKLAIAIVTIFIAILLGNISTISSINEKALQVANILLPNQQSFIFGEQELRKKSSSSIYAAAQIMESCREENGGAHCPMTFLNNLSKIEESRLVLTTFLELVRLYDENNYSCHQYGHHLGMWLYEHMGNPKDALKYATIYCGGSVYHGIFQNYFEDEEAINNLDRSQIAIIDLCPVSQGNANWLHERDCIHGIGHGLAKLYNYNTLAAVDRCNEFVPIWAQSACSRGVFMENIEYFIETGLGDFNTTDIYSPCTGIIEKFASQCYYYYPAYDLARNGITLSYNITGTFAKCDDIPSAKFSKYCYQGIGRLLESFAYTNAKLSIATCYLGNQTKYHNDCLLGTLKTMLKGYADPSVGFTYCSKSNLDFKAICYQIVGMWIKSFLHAGKADLENECAKAPETNYINNCINTNQTTDEYVSLFEPI